VANRGRLEIRVAGRWGTVCDDQFGDLDARVACSMLGYRYVADLKISPRQKNLEIYFTGNYYVNFGHFAGRNHLKFGNFVNFSGKSHKKFGYFDNCSDNQIVKFGHFVNFSYIFWGQKCLPPKVD